ncbi:MAG: adenine deaminase [Bacteroidia bacterium]|nr:adenine deaminase [Bacteroidia bacterium]
MNTIKGNIVDVVNKEIYKGEIFFTDVIEKIERKNVEENEYILPGFVNAHVHIESSMLSPFEFSKQVVKHGTVAVVTDPHEIANVLGIEGVNYMIENAKNGPIKVFFGAPSCVPSTTFESSGSVINSKDIDELLSRKEIFFLSEMMNFPGVIFGNKEVHAKLNAAKKYNKPVDGHAPGLSKIDIQKYISSGISTDHECFNIQEALDKINFGMKVQIREGSAAKNFEALFPLIESHPEMIMLCTDDSHPDDLLKGHINILAKRAFEKNLDYFNVLRTCSYNPIKHYNLPVGLLQKGDAADFIICTDKYASNISAVYINGKEKLSENYNQFSSPSPNNFKATSIAEKDISFKNIGKFCNIISVIDGELITQKEKLNYSEVFNNDNTFKFGFNKIVVINRYEINATPVIGIVKNFNIKNGAIASTIAHDSHNIISIGDSDFEIAKAINLVIESKGGISACNKNNSEILPLEIAGIMTSKNAEWVAEKYKAISDFAKKELCTNLHAPFMTMSFLALLVIPELKIGDKGLFDIRTLEFVHLFEN